MERIVESYSAIQETQVADSNRMTRVEQALLHLTESAGRAERSYNEVSAKLDFLPRVEATMQRLALMCEKAVTREEWEQRNRTFDERITGLERGVDQVTDANRGAARPLG